MIVPVLKKCNSFFELIEKPGTGHILKKQGRSNKVIRAILKYAPYHTKELLISGRRLLLSAFLPNLV
ncbi:hypothetical protein AM493_18520 [Flavobacterium akiainvivens]|uniref:Uncharacterized protein n=1 Tax=Flavobacterium akiainvivens TaxID=1202724 RepID=A0A0M8MDC5_9FLAO|nr:hypothetical protein AM493_18520 [Flavobacterium akiainvivens]